jgi:hypothetical protein
MQLIKPHSLCVLMILAAATCGPEPTAQEKESTWMLGVWSSESVGLETSNCGVHHLKIEANGKAFNGGDNCGLNPTYPTELTWERDGEDAIIVHFPEGLYNFDAWRMFLVEGSDTQAPQCNSLSIEEIRDGITRDSFYGFVRGAVCTDTNSQCPENVGNCGYFTVWCDEPPERCEDVLPCCA